MVVKHRTIAGSRVPGFEYGVILNGSQTKWLERRNHLKFEYGVIFNGSQTKTLPKSSANLFEYGVILNGSQSRQK